MGKRSNFKRRPQDAYDTPEAAVFPLLPFLPDGRFIYHEPCAGMGALWSAISKHKDAYATLSDIRIRGDLPLNNWCFEFDAIHLDEDMIGDADYIITNPPWTRQILHPMIEHLSAMRPTWLLFDADWMHTKQAVPYLQWCRKIVSVGRVKWIPDSPHTGKDNCAWYLFDQSVKGPTVFYGRDNA
jgi:hypothetical protein